MRFDLAHGVQQNADGDQNAGRSRGRRPPAESPRGRRCPTVLSARLIDTDSAFDGLKFQAVASARSVAEREAVKRYLDVVEAGDQ